MISHSPEKILSGVGGGQGQQPTLIALVVAAPHALGGLALPLAALHLVDGSVGCRGGQGPNGWLR